MAVIKKELFDESTCEWTALGGIRVTRVFEVSGYNYTNNSWDSQTGGGGTVASGTDSPAAYANLIAVSDAELPDIYEKQVFYPFGSDASGLGKKFNIVCTRKWTKPDSTSYFKVYTEWQDNSGQPLLLDSGAVMQCEGMLSLVQYNRDVNNSGIQCLYVPDGMSSGDASGNPQYNVNKLIDKYIPHLTRSFTVTVTTDPYHEVRAVLGKVDSGTRTQLCTGASWILQGCGYYTVKLMIAEELQGWDKIAVWEGPLGVPKDVASGVRELCGWENGPLLGVQEIKNGANRPPMYDYFTVPTVPGTSGDRNLPWQIGEILELPYSG